MPWWVAALWQVGLYVGTALLSALLNKSSAETNQPGEPQFPKADPQAAIPVVYGTTRIGINVISKAGITLGENTVRNGALSFGWSSTHIGYFYYLDLHAIVCHGPVGALHEVYVDGTKKLSPLTAETHSIGIGGITYTTAPAIDPPLPDWTYNQAFGREFTITAGRLLGGKMSRGGIGAGGDTGSTGLMRFCPGTGGVEHNTRFETLHGGDLPTYPHFCTVYFEDDFYFGNSEQLPSIEFVVSSAPEAFSTGYIGNVLAMVGNEGNPGNILYDLLTNTVYGLGLPASDLNTVSFFSVAKACDTAIGGPNEFDFGLSFVLTEQTPAKTVLTDLLRTLDGVLYTDAATGLLSVWLMRAPDAPYFGYEVADEVVLDESNIVALEWTESAADALVNEVRVEFIDRDRDYTKNVVTARNVAAIHALGRVESRTVSFLGVQSRELAQRLAERELKALSSVLGQGTATLDRTGYFLHPGQFVTLSWDAFGIANKIARVVSARDTQFGQVEVDLVEDVYASPAPSFATEDTPEPVPPAAEAFVVPYVEPEWSGSSLGGTGTLFVYDPQGNVTAIDFMDDPAGVWHAANNPVGWVGPYSPYVNFVGRLADGEVIVPQWRVTYTASDGTTAYIYGDFPDVPGLPLIPAAELSYTVSGGTVTVTATWADGYTTHDLYFYVSSAGFDTWTSGDTPTAGPPYQVSFPYPAAGDVVYVTAIRHDGVSGLGTSSYLTIEGAGLGGGGGGSSYEADPVVPVAADFTLENAGTATMADGIGGLKLTMPSSGSNIRFMRYNAGVPGATWALEMRGSMLTPWSSSAIHHNSVILRDSGSGKIINFTHSGGQVTVQGWNNYSTFTGTTFGYSVFLGIYSGWKKVTSDGTTLRFYTSTSGKDWAEIGSTTIAAFIGAVDQVGIGSVNGGVSGLPDNVDIFESFSVT